MVEVGAGDGANFAFYPDEVERIVAVEPEPFLRERASGHADERVQLRNAVASSLPVADGEADAVVLTLVLCSVDQQPRWPRPAGCCAPAASCASSSTSRPTSRGDPQGPARPRRHRVASAVRRLPLSAGTRPARSPMPGSPSTELERLTFPEGARGPEASVIIGCAVAA